VGGLNLKENINKVIESFKIEEALGSVINRASIVMKKKLAELMKEAGYDITPEEFAILSRLWDKDGLFQTEITEKTLKDKTRVTRLLGGLIEKSLVEKKIDESDRRNFHIHLTEKGKALKYEVLPIVIKLMGIASANIHKNDLEITKETLKTIFINLNSNTNEI
jgi:DNA-binding MarR family transcriptional regulator